MPVEMECGAAVESIRISATAFNTVYVAPAVTASSIFNVVINLI